MYTALTIREARTNALGSVTSTFYEITQAWQAGVVLREKTGSKDTVALNCKLCDGKNMSLTH